MSILKRIIRRLRNEIIYVATTAAGFYFYYCFKRKIIVFIASVERAGSTLLKALLAEASDVSHLPEIDFKYRINRYNFYFYCRNLSSKEIIVLKRPALFYPEKYPPAAFSFVRFIILYRHPLTWFRSVRDTFQKSKLPELDASLSDQDLLDFWCKTYAALLDHPKLQQSLRIGVAYESLIENPVAVTRQVFLFMGSKRQAGCETYHHPEHFKWKWGTDDGGEKIQQLRVIKSFANETAKPAWQPLLDQSSCFAALWKRLEALRKTSDQS